MSILIGSAAAASDNFDHSLYGVLLEKHVDGRGMVDYQGLKMDHDKLSSYLSKISSLNQATYNAFSKQGKIAFWINAYNALTLKAIIDHYPIQSSTLRSIRFPKNSIRQISGVWTELKFTVMGRKMTLDEIEHQVIRKQFDEPRIHLALVCAAIGCPPLRSESYTGEQLDEQLNSQAKRFFSNPRKFRIDTDKNVAYLSPIFKWFGKDFEGRHSPAEGFTGFKQSERAVLNYISRHKTEKVRDFLFAGGYSIKYLDYDWSLNEQK